MIPRRGLDRPSFGLKVGVLGFSAIRLEVAKLKIAKLTLNFSFMAAQCGVLNG